MEKLWNFHKLVINKICDKYVTFLFALPFVLSYVLFVSFVPCFAICLAYSQFVLLILSSLTAPHAVLIVFRISSPSACFLSWLLFCLVSCPGFYLRIWEILGGKTLMQVLQIKICKCEAFGVCVQQSLWKRATLITVIAG